MDESFEEFDTGTPDSVRYFNIFYLANILVSAVSFFVVYLLFGDRFVNVSPSVRAYAELIYLVVVICSILSVMLSLWLWYGVSRKRSNAARILLCLFFLTGIFGFIPHIPVPGWVPLLKLAAIGAEGVAVWMLFQPDMTEWYRDKPSPWAD